MVDFSRPSGMWRTLPGGKLGRWWCMIRRWLSGGMFVFLLAVAAQVFGGGSGLNVVVIVNSNSTNSVQLGNYYCEKRQVPPQNVLRASWSGGNTEWTRAQFEATILNPLLAMISARQLTNQIDYVVVCMDFPYRISDS